ncbi:MAG: tRNA guanosine(34) transglycosylase Tgt [Acidobacteriota bacterium]
MFDFQLLARDSGARRGILRTAHGQVATPAFIPVATQGSVKALTHRQVLEAGAEILLCNTYHLMLRPGAERIAALGGLHRLIGWDGPILTDSGGFQVASLSSLRTVTDDGVTFRSHLDGSPLHLTPERAVEIQEMLGSDVAMVLDQCLLYPVERGAAWEAANRSLRWAVRCRAQHRRQGQALFGIVHGAVFPELRRENARALVELELDGYAIGGLAVGEPKPLMREMTSVTTELLPEESPRYLMGVGTPVDIVESVARGVDLFDCVLPTRNARNGTLFTSQGKLSIKNARYAHDPSPPDTECPCYTCAHFSRAYLRHLFLAREMTAASLNTIHNLSFYLRLMAVLRDAIQAGRFAALRGEVNDRLSSSTSGLE